MSTSATTRPSSAATTSAPAPTLVQLATAAVAETRQLLSVDRTLSERPVGGVAYRSRRRRIRTLRWTVQGLSLAVVVTLGVQFVVWVRGLEAGQVTVARPPGVEGFLPISGLLSLRHLLASGEVSPVHPAALAILLAVVATSLVLKKSFCSWVCPVGAISEYLGAASEKLFGRRLRLPVVLDLPLRSLKYLLLAFFAHAIFVVMTPRAVAAFLESPYNRVADIKMLYFFEQLSPLALEVLVGLVLLSFFLPGFWCRYLCPYGALLGFLSLFSPLKVTRHAPSCTDCGLCTRACPSHLPVERLKRVRSDECTGCLSCVAACPVSRALTVQTPAPWRRAVRPAMAMLLVMVLFYGGLTVARLGGWWHTNIPQSEYQQRIHELDGPQYNHFRGGTAPRR